ncbi:shikimate kinase [bacterium endosymbiont of Bathymodiolus sp. 5 South]|jgi:shikimate kinase|uniref:shikimate kinase n=1 Tax=bacterium endosymbiont of Bathymodiolus sp. 5 South TaxID=1181670 RepID=UPI0010BAEB2D|nr:shikimate kinase [bacterium endosymbiont of Bathymodiolus sp. 5 South]CAC9457703.1 Shikimate kinase I (EC 2.7.1.71) [uncultured Gammaproteobacteria bacterium]CAC9652910.1 Shikimate kinase I (EC 2.7.1.71) [uncultured Gammaproteobacteria bacterium]CAC9653113.1 Shikimate kinase I (EC 2.7.1.71) [uncultured Gammaproteobacteria bacterium]CAC9658940.1 Shikimate kinase I (EC 2.7.1.71) [uncultured Gammaproteobacteria bacterium]SHN91970.1 Shikimate kinase I [bacterium endosymbiont of Bathymodiolus sp
MAKSTKNIVLVGPMGSGKTSVGRRLACVLKRDFFDTDFEIVARTGVAIDYIFDVEGESGFRQREIQMLEDLCKIPNIVIATGGGIVIKEVNRALLKKECFVVYLSSSVEQLVKRTAKSKARPLLEQSNDREKTLRDLLQAREGFYQQVADMVVDTTGKKLYAIINEIKKAVNK